jgi:hypothetical protein
MNGCAQTPIGDIIIKKLFVPRINDVFIRGRKRLRPGEYYETPIRTRSEMIEIFQQYIQRPTLYPSPLMYITDKGQGRFEIIYKFRIDTLVHNIASAYGYEVENIPRL